MGITWSASAEKHGISREDVIWAMANAVCSVEIPGEPGWKTFVWVGHPHAQTERYIEVIAGTRGRDLKIFHAMPLTTKYRHLIE